MISFKRILAGAAVGALCTLAGVPAQAALVQSTAPSVTTWLDTNLSGVALIYDANFYSTTEGRLVVLASGNSLRGPGVPNNNVAGPNPALPGAIPAQIYLGPDQFRDPMITLRINNQTGALVSGTVSVTASNDAVPNDSWSFLGTITQFGFSERNGTATTNTFDARFTVNSYDLSDVVQGLVGPASQNPSAPTVCLATNPWCGMGYLRIGADLVPFLGGANSAVNFAADWVRGVGVITGTTPNPQLGTFDDGIAAAAYNNAAVSSDIFMTVPVPGAFALFAAGLLGLGPLARRRRHRV